MGRGVSIVQADSSNLKITRKGDVPIAEAIIKARPKPKLDGPTGPYVEAQWLLLKLTDGQFESF